MSTPMTVAEYKERRAILEEKYLAAYEEAISAYNDGRIHLWEPSDKEIGKEWITKRGRYSSGDLSDVSIEELECHMQKLKDRMRDKVGKNRYTARLREDDGYVDLVAEYTRVVSKDFLARAVDTIVNGELSVSLVPEDRETDYPRVINCNLVDSWVDGKLDTETLQLAVYWACDV